MQILPTGPYIFTLRPFAATTDWYLREWTLLCPLYIDFSQVCKLALPVFVIKQKQ